MDQGAGKLNRRDDGVRMRSARLSASEPPELEDVPVEAQEIERTRNHMSETIEQIQERLVPERVVEEAKETATEVTEDAKEAVMEVLQEVRTTAEDWSEIARVAALETVDHAMEQAKAALPTVSDQARDLAQETIDHAITEAKAAIRELGDQARLAVHDATIGKVERMAQTTSDSTKSFGSGLITRVKQNPGPAALAGLGLGWLMMSGKSGSQAPSSSTTSSTSTSSYSTGSATGTDQAKGATGAVTGQVKDTANQAMDAAGTVADQAQHVAGMAVDQAQDAAGKVTDQTKQAASAVTGEVSQLSSTLSTQVKQFSTQIQQTVTHNPLAAGAVALAVGSAAGMIVPVTPREQKLMGGTRDKLMERAQTGATDLVQKVQRVAEEAGSAAEREAKYQGLSSEE